jgi:hypothetical protein
MTNEDFIHLPYTNSHLFENEGERERGGELVRTV